MEFLEVKRGFVESLKKGEGLKCPCCRRWAKINKVNFHKGMMFTLKVIAAATEKNPKKYVHVENHLVDLGIKIKGVHGKLKYWGLIEQRSKDETEDHKKTSGYWRLTDKGRAFVEDRISVPKSVIVFNDRVLRFDGEEIFYKDRVESFHYEKMLKETVSL